MRGRRRDPGLALGRRRLRRALSGAADAVRHPDELQRGHDLRVPAARVHLASLPELLHQRRLDRLAAATRSWSRSWRARSRQRSARPPRSASTSCAGSVAAALRTLLMVPIVTPAIVTATSVYIAFLQWRLVGSLTGYVLAHAAIATPFVVVSVTSALGTFDPAAAARGGFARRLAVPHLPHRDHAADRPRRADRRDPGLRDLLRRGRDRAVHPLARTSRRCRSRCTTA